MRIHNKYTLYTQHCLLDEMWKKVVFLVVVRLNFNKNLGTQFRVGKRVTKIRGEKYKNVSIIGILTIISNSWTTLYSFYIRLLLINSNRRTLFRLWNYRIVIIRVVGVRRLYKDF